MKWENPPPQQAARNPGGKVWAEEAAELRAHPGHWGVLAEYQLAKTAAARQLAHIVKTGKCVAFRPEGAFDAVTRTEGETVKVYVICYEQQEEKS